VIAMTFRAAKQGFFDRAKVKNAVDAGTRRVLSRFGAFVRTRARTSIRKKKGTSPPGSPPHSHVGLLRKFILFAYDPQRKSVVIGPTLIRAESRRRLPACSNTAARRSAAPRPGRAGSATAPGRSWGRPSRPSRPDCPPCGRTRSTEETPMAVKLGLDAKLYRNTGTHGSPAWNEVTKVRDVTLSLEAGEADVTTRGNNGWRATVATLKDASVEFDMVWDTADDDFGAIRDAFLNRAAIEFAVMDGDIAAAGSQGLRATCMVTNFSRNESLEEAITVSVTVKPTFSTTAPTWHVVP